MVVTDMPMSIDGLMVLAARALAGGGHHVSPLVVEWDTAGRCESPVERDLQAGPYRAMAVRELDPRRYISGRAPKWKQAAKFAPKWRTGFTVRMTVKCRKCRRCLMQRARQWKLRAVTEVKQSARTWFGTITVAPHVHNRFLNECRAKESRSGVNFDALPQQERIGLLHMRIAIEITKWLKRVRKVSKAKLRYLLCMESVTNHQEGLPHYHILVHEVSGLKPVRHATLKEQWPHGFVNFKLVTSAREAAYVTKYLSKDIGARVRASVSYGKTSSDIIDIKSMCNFAPHKPHLPSEVDGDGPVPQENDIAVSRSQF